MRAEMDGDVFARREGERSATTKRSVGGAASESRRIGGEQFPTVRMVRGGPNPSAEPRDRKSSFLKV